MSYAKPVKSPANIQEGTANHIQLAINYLERGDAREALLQLVDLLDQIASGHLVVKLRDAGDPNGSGPIFDNAAMLAARQYAFHQGQIEMLDRVKRFISQASAKHTEEFFSPLEKLLHESDPARQTLPEGSKHTFDVDEGGPKL